jgi:hypothetical protein
MMKNSINNSKMYKRGFALILSVITLITLTLSSCNGGGGNNDGRSQVSDNPSDTASIVFTEYEHYFGKVEAGEKVVSVFSYENKGTVPLVISSASTSCGCTVSKYSTKPLAPGEKGSLEVTFDSSGRNGKQTKTITVRSNATKPVVLLRITGEVLSGNNN